MSLKRRIAKLEALAHTSAPYEVEVGDTAKEIREIDRNIRELDREIAELDRKIADRESRMSPEELAESRRERVRWDEELASLTAGLSLDETIEYITNELAKLEASKIESDQARGGEGAS